VSSERLEELLWLRADGTLNEEEREELAALLATHPDAHRVEREVEDLALQLSRLPRVAAPPELRDRIGRALAGARSPLPADTDRQVARLRPKTGWPGRLLPLAAGLVLGAAITQLLHLGTGPASDGSRAVGSMQATPLERPQEVDLGGDVGSVQLDPGNGTLAVELRLVGDARVTLALAAEAEEPRLVATGHSGGSECTVATEGGRVVLRARGPGLHRLWVDAPDAAQRLRLEVAIAGVGVVERWVEVGPSGGPP